MTCRVQAKGVRRDGFPSKYHFDGVPNRRSKMTHYAIVLRDGIPTIFAGEVALVALCTAAGSRVLERAERLDTPATELAFDAYLRGVVDGVVLNQAPVQGAEIDIPEFPSGANGPRDG